MRGGRGGRGAIVPSVFSEGHRGDSSANLERSISERLHSPESSFGLQGFGLAGLSSTPPSTGVSTSPPSTGVPKSAVATTATTTNTTTTTTTNKRSRGPRGRVARQKKKARKAARAENSKEKQAADEAYAVSHLAEMIDKFEAIVRPKVEVEFQRQKLLGMCAIFFFCIIFIHKIT